MGVETLGVVVQGVDDDKPRRDLRARSDGPAESVTKECSAAT